MDKLEVRRVSSEELEIINGGTVYRVRVAPDEGLRVSPKRAMQSLKIRPICVSSIHISAEDMTW